MADNLMRKLPFTRFAMEMRSGKIIEIDEVQVLRIFDIVFQFLVRLHEKWSCVQGYCAGY